MRQSPDSVLLFKSSPGGAVMKKMRVLFATAVCGGLVASCGGGGGSSSGSVSGQSIPLYFTDDMSLYASITVRVYEVNLCSDNQCQQKVNLYSNQQGLEIDLAKLNGVLQYINTASIPQGTYNRLEVILDRNLSIVDGSGQTHDAVFTPMQEKPNKPNVVQCPDSSKCYIRFNGTVQPFAMGKLIVDFNLKEFEVNTQKSPWEVYEVKMMPVTPPSQPDMKLCLAVQNVQENRITGTWMGRTFTINITQNTVCEINGAYYSGNSCAGQIQQGMCIEVKTRQDPASSSSLDAVEIESEKPSRCMMSSGVQPSKPRELKGYVNSVNITDSTFTLRNYSTPIKVTNNTYCRYQRGAHMTGMPCLSSLQAGWLVGVKVNSSGEALRIQREF